MKIQHDFSLRKLNTFGVDVTAKYFTEINTAEEASELVRSPLFKKGKRLIIGGGSNLLFTKDFDGLIVKVNIEGIHVVKEDQKSFFVKAGAGVEWHDLVISCVNADFGGLENLSLIPGTVGAAPVQNIGAYGVELKDTFEALEAIDVQTGDKRYFLNKDCRFGYRDSIFKNEFKDRFLISNVVFRLLKKPVLRTDYGKIREVLAASGKNEFTVKDISRAIIQIRTEKLPDPKKTGNAGSFFKNPVVSKEFFTSLNKSYPDMPFYKQPDNSIKIPAAWLIDQCNCKRLRKNGAAVHPNQALVLINKRNATGQDILDLSKIVQKKVNDKFAVNLEPEVRII